MKIVTVVGARPQFIKAAAVSRLLRQRATEILVHTGQHYDYNMSDVFFDELKIPKPNYNLGISRGTHGQMTGKMLTAIEDVLQNEKPNMLLVYGDTNSTLAAALAAVKLHIPVCHVEAGNRLGTLNNPEEVNRICTDHVSSLLLGCTESAMEFMRKEGLQYKAKLVGDPMYDAFLYFGSQIRESDKANIHDLAGTVVHLPEAFYYLTCHRQENTDSDEKLTQILCAMNGLDAPTIYPVHPRNHDRAVQICRVNRFNNIMLVQPVGYLTSIALISSAKKIVTDSGGLQREAFFARKQCLFVFDHIAWPETMVGNRNQLVKPDAEDIVAKLNTVQTVDAAYQPFGDGHAGDKIVEALLEFYNKEKV